MSRYSDDRFLEDIFKNSEISNMASKMAAKIRAGHPRRVAF
jgi:hypothetical protein